MPHPSKRPSSSASQSAFPIDSEIGALAQQSQLDFEIEFFEKLLATTPDFADVLRILSANLTLKGRLLDGLAVDRQLVKVCPVDPTAHYNLACRFAVLKQADHAIRSLRKAVELGYHDYRYMEEDGDLDSIRKDPRYRQIVRDYRSQEKRKG